MKMTVNKSMFIGMFRNMGRKGSFSYDGLLALFEYFEDMESETGEEVELDVIAICCDYSEENYKNIADYYNIDLAGCGDEEDHFHAVCDYLEENTSIIYSDIGSGNILYQNF